ncbi:MAG: O-antigen ligase family protein [Adhaeribacter sp.]
MPLALGAAVLTGWLTARVGILVPGALVALPFVAAVVGLILYQPKFGMALLLGHSFFMHFFLKHVPAIPWGYVTELIILTMWLSVVFNPAIQFNWKMLKNDFCYIPLVWLGISILQIINPYGASLAGFVSEIRSTSLVWFLLVPLCFIIFNSPKDLKLFLLLTIAFSLLATFYGMKQLHIGLDAADQKFLDDGAAKTHLLWGKLRVFSVFSDAGQFGASQALMGLVTVILALGPFKLWKKALFALAAMIIFYGMLISGTRGALFALVAGIFAALFLSKQTKILIIGGMVACSGLFVLKYTTIGNGNYNILRMRSALDPEDPSLNVRFNSQRILREYLAAYPFGGGLGVIGANGHKHNSDKFLSTIEPDSYWVKIWAMYGIVGLIIWMAFNLYILGKCAGILWNLQDLGLKTKLLALMAGMFGAFIASYGNEVMNALPTSAIYFISSVFIFLSPRFEKEVSNPDAYA